MATNTQEYNFQKPEVGGDSDNWGDMLNGNWDITDSLLRGATQLTNIGIGATNTTIPLVCNAASAADITATFSGKVGIGTTSPQRALHVESEVRIQGAYPKLEFVDTDNNPDFTIIGGNEQLQFYDETNATSRMNIDTSGNVGIGTSNPQSDGNTTNLEVSSAFGSRVLVNNTDTNGRKYGIYSDNAGRFGFADYTADSTRMLIDSSGNVGIGTDSPAGNLHISAGTDGDATLILEADTDNLGDEDDNPKLQLRQDGGLVVGEMYLEGEPDQTATGSNYNYLLIDAKNGEGTNRIQFATGGTTGSSPTNSTVRATITDSGHFIIDGPNYSFQSDNYHLRLREDDGSCYLSNVQGGLYVGSSGYYYGSGQFKLTDGATSMASILCAQNGNITFSNVTGGSANGVVTANERMRIDALGNVMVGTTDSTLYNNNASGSNSTGILLTQDGRIEAARYGATCASLNRMANNGSVLNFYNSGNLVGYINTTSNSSNHVESSDQRLKENITDSGDAGSVIDAMQVRQFDWLSDGSHEDYGFIAQELADLVPNAVFTADDEQGTMGVAYNKLVPMLIKEVQALRARVAELEENA